MAHITHCAEFRVKRNSAIGEWQRFPQPAILRTMPKVVTDTHQHLRAWRKSRGLTLERLANIIGSKISTIGGWETGARAVDLDDLTKLAAAYGVHPATLLFAPPGGEQFERLREADGLLRAMGAEDASDWLRLGRRLTQPPDGRTP